MAIVSTVIFIYEYIYQVNCILEARRTPFEEDCEKWILGKLALTYLRREA